MLLLLACSQLRAQAPADVARLNQQLTPLAAVRAGSGFADLAPLVAVVAPARVVGLGESTHDTHALFQLQPRLLEYLVTQQGFTTLALEVDYGWGKILKEYISGCALTTSSTPLKFAIGGIDRQNPAPNLPRLEHFAPQRADTVPQRQVRNLRAYYSAPNQAAADAEQRLVRLSNELGQHLQAVAAPAAMQQHAQGVG